MRRSLTLLVVSLFIVPASTLGAPSPVMLPEAPDLGFFDVAKDLLPGDDDQFIVGHGEAVPESLEALVILHGGQTVRTDSLLDFTVVTVDAARADSFRQTALLLPDVRYVVIDGEVEAHFTPNDPLYPQQWGPPAIGIEPVWDLTRGNHSIEVAVLDTGVDYTHPDLVDNVCRLGPDFINDDGDPMDDHAHGTHVAGTVAAKIDNGVGVAGMADVCVVPVKVLNAWGSGTWSTVASGIAWAAENGVDIISMSLGGCCPADPIEDALVLAELNGVLVIASAGNSGCGGDRVGYPAAYPQAIAVASLSAPGDHRSSFSSCGPAVEVAAPGHEIISTVPGFSDPSGYATYSGTSMAAPHVAGVAALWWSAHPEATAVEVRCVLAQKAVDMQTPGRDVETGFGRIDPAAMFADPFCTVQVPEAPVIEGRSGHLSAALQWNTPFAWGGVDSYRVYRGTAPDALTFLANSTTLAHVDADLPDGATYHYAVAAVNAAGESPLSDPVNVTVRTAVQPPEALDFENGFEEWTATGLWGLTTDRSASGHSAYFGVENGPGPENNTYYTGRSEYGVLESPPILLPQGDSSMRFWQFFDMEGWIAAYPVVEIATEEAPFSFATIWHMGAYDPYEGPAAIDLSAYAGQVVYLRFVVDAPVTWWAHDHEGWYVDEVQIVAEPAPQYEPTTRIVFPTSDGMVPADTFLAGVYTDPNGDQDVINVTYRLNGGPEVAVALQGHFWYDQAVGLPTGTHTIDVTVRDSADHIATDSLIFEVDGEPPTVEVYSPGPSESVSCGFTLQGIARDEGSGLSSLSAWVPVGGGRFHTFAGEAEAHWNLTLDVTLVPEGPFEVTLRVWDKAGNLNDTQIGLVRDATDCRPQIDLVSPHQDEVLTCVVTVTGTAWSPVGSGLYWADVYLDGRFVGWDPLYDDDTFRVEVPLGREALGVHEIRVVVTDSSYYWNEVVVAFVREDADCLPKAKILLPLEGSSADCRILFSGVASSPNGDLSPWVTLRSGGVLIGSGFVSALGVWAIQARTGPFPAGDFHVVAHVQDHTGNWDTSAPFVLTRSDMDCRPTVEITDPVDGTTADCHIEVRGSAASHSGAQLARVTLFIGGQPVGEAWIGGMTVDEWSATARLAYIAPGTHVLTARVADADGNHKTSEGIQIIRSGASCLPTLQLLGPSDGETVDGAVDVHGIVTIPSGEQGFLFVGILPADWSRSVVTNGGSYSFSWNTLEVENGVYHIFVDLWIPGEAWMFVSVEVTVENQIEPRIETEAFEGMVGCAVGWMMIHGRDLCGDENRHTSRLDEGWTSARLVLTWDGTMPGGIDGLSVSLTAGGSSWTATSMPGDDMIVLEVEVEDPMFRPTTATIDVRAAYGGLAPSLVLEQEYQIEVVWGYWHAELP